MVRLQVIECCIRNLSSAVFEISCTSCGYPVKFRRESSVFATCESCRSVLARHDVNLEQIGKAADLQPDGTPLQVGTTGVYDGKAFEIVGRIQVRQDGGFWNEWYINFANGDDGWLGEALGEYFINSQAKIKSEVLPTFDKLYIGREIKIGMRPFSVSNKGTSTVVSYEGELPFVMTSSYDLPYVDLRSGSKVAATLDYSDGPPILFLGYYINFSDLQFKNLRDPDDELERRSARSANVLRCPTCGAPHELAAGPRSQTLACGFCDSVIDLTDPSYKVIFKASQAEKEKPLIPLNTVGKVDGLLWECIAYMRKYSVYGGTRYYWREFLCYNRENGYRYLTESEGHWAWVQTINEVPLIAGTSSLASTDCTSQITYKGINYKHFQAYQGHVAYVVGEFPYKVTQHSVNNISDFTAPPYSLCQEADNEGIYWSFGRYMEPKEVLESFNLTDVVLPARIGVGTAQIAPTEATNSFLWKTWLMFAMIGFICVFFFSLFHGEIFEQTFEINSCDECSVVTNPFKVTGLPKALTVNFSTNLKNRWAYFDMDLVNQQTKKSTKFSKSMRYFTDTLGYEGSSSGSVIVPGISAGEYVIKIKPQTGTTSTKPDPTGDNNVAKKQQYLRYTINVRQGASAWFVYWLCLFILAGPPIWTFLLKQSEETQRWSNSDYCDSDDD